VPSAAKSAVAPLYLFACLILGGSAQGIWQNALLQLAGLGIIAWAAIAPSAEPMGREARGLLLLFLAGLALVAAESVPLPPAVWAHGARLPIAEGYRLLGIPVPWLPVSVSPYASFSALLCVIPPMAIFVAIVRLHAYRRSWLAAALLAGTAGGILLGALQVMNPGTESQWYLYPQTNVGRAVGFFANASHMAILLIMSLPFLAATAAAGRGRNIQRYSALIAVLVAGAILLVVGVALNGSLAGYLLIVPALVASALIVLPRQSRFRGILAAAAGISAIAAVAFLATSPIGTGAIEYNANTSIQSRSQILAKTAVAVRDFMPVGSGLGSFPKVYRLYESPDTVTDEYVVHAHNDYVELALELGVAGVILILVFLAWWGRAVWKLWRRADRGAFAYAASIASAVVLIHSVVEFPLRTAAIATCFAMSLALLSDRRTPQRDDGSDLRPTRHIVIR
jgi:O-antigen ligase